MMAVLVLCTVESTVKRTYNCRSLIFISAKRVAVDMILFQFAGVGSTDVLTLSQVIFFPETSRIIDTCLQSHKKKHSKEIISYITC